LDGAYTSVGIAVLSVTQEIRAITNGVTRTDEGQEKQNDLTINDIGRC